MPDTPTLIVAVWILSLLGLFFAIKIMRKKFLKEQLSGERCWKCHERYVGLALDCRCTNWGR